jgi:hypothetical protein
LLSEFERAHKNNNGNWRESLSSTVEVAISSTSNKPVKTDKEYLVNLEKKINDITRDLDKVWSKNLHGLSLENGILIPPA